MGQLRVIFYRQEVGLGVQVGLVVWFVALGRVYIQLWSVITCEFCCNVLMNYFYRL